MSTILDSYMEVQYIDSEKYINPATCLLMFIQSDPHIFYVLDKANKFAGIQIKAINPKIYDLNFKPNMYLLLRIGVAGFEPTTSPTPRVRATRLRYTPMLV